MQIGERLKKERISRKITQEVLAGNLGVSRTTLCAWESGKRVPSIKYIREYCKLFGLSTDFFAKKEKPPIENIGVSFDLSKLNYKGVKRLQEFYNELIKEDEYIKKP